MCLRMMKFPGKNFKKQRNREVDTKKPRRKARLQSLWNRFTDQSPWLMPRNRNLTRAFTPNGTIMSSHQLIKYPRKKVPPKKLSLLLMLRRCKLLKLQILSCPKKKRRRNQSYILTGAKIWTSSTKSRNTSKATRSEKSLLSNLIIIHLTRPTRFDRFSA